MRAVGSLLASSPAIVDELVVLGLAGMTWYCALGLYAVLIAHQPFDPLTYASGIATVIGATGVAKRLRDGVGSSTAGAEPVEGAAGTGS